MTPECYMARNPIEESNIIGICELYRRTLSIGNYEINKNNVDPDQTLPSVSLSNSFTASNDRDACLSKSRDGMAPRL